MNAIIKNNLFCYIVLKLEDGFYGLQKAKIVVRFVDSESDHEVEQQAKVVRFSGRGPRESIPVIIVDGWMKLKMGNFSKIKEKMEMLKRD